MCRTWSPEEQAKSPSLFIHPTSFDVSNHTDNISLGYSSDQTYFPEQRCPVQTVGSKDKSICTPYDAKVVSIFFMEDLCIFEYK